MSGSLDLVCPRPARPDDERVLRVAGTRTLRDVAGFIAVADDGGVGRSHWRIWFISALSGLPADDDMGAWWKKGHSVGLEYLAGLIRSAPG